MSKESLSVTFDETYRDFYSKNKNRKMWGCRPSRGVVVLQNLLDADRSSTRVLDVGGGEGRNSIYLAKAGFDVTLVEASGVALGVARKWAKAEGLCHKIRFIHGDIANIGFNDEYFDAVIDAFMLPFLHSEKHSGYTRKAFSVLKCDGLFLLETLSGRVKVHGLRRKYLTRLLQDFHILSWTSYLWYYERVPQHSYAIIGRKGIR